MPAAEKPIYLSNIIIFLHKSNHSTEHCRLFQIATLFALQLLFVTNIFWYFHANVTMSARPATRQPCLILN